MNWSIHWTAATNHQCRPPPPPPSPLPLPRACKGAHHITGQSPQPLHPRKQCEMRLLPYCMVSRYLQYIIQYICSKNFVRDHIFLLLSLWYVGLYQKHGKEAAPLPSLHIIILSHKNATSSPPSFSRCHAPAANVNTAPPPFHLHRLSLSTATATAFDCCHRHQQQLSATFYHPWYGASLGGPKTL